MNYQNANLKIDKDSKKFLGRDNEPERSNIDNIYMVGDTVHEVPELMPVA